MFEPQAGAGGSEIDLARSLATATGISSQVIGIILILAGSYYALAVLVDVLAAARNPAGLEATLLAMVKLLELIDAALEIGSDQISLGRPAALVALVLSYLVASWIALGLVGIGGRMVLGIAAERREFLTAMRELLAATRQENNPRPGGKT